VLAKFKVGKSTLQKLLLETQVHKFLLAFTPASTKNPYRGAGQNLIARQHSMLAI
jgi:hypothetical protein